GYRRHTQFRLAGWPDSPDLWDQLQHGAWRDDVLLRNPGGGQRDLRQHYAVRRGGSSAESFVGGVSGGGGQGRWQHQPRRRELYLRAGGFHSAMQGDHVLLNR